MIPEGTYKAKAVTAALGYTSGGSEQVAVEFEILDDDPEIGGRRITWYGYFTERTFDRTIESLQYCGFRGNDLSDLSGVTTNEVQIVVTHEEYNGRISARVQWVNRLGGLAIRSRMSDEDARKFSARMRSKIAAAGGSAATPPTGDTAKKTAPVSTEKPLPDDDEIPF